MSNREIRLREIRERVEKAKAEVGIPYSSEWDQFLIEEDVPWLLDLVDEYKFDPAERTYLECRVRNLEGDLAFYLNEDPETKAKLDRWCEIMDKAPHELDDSEREELATLTGELVGPTPDPDPAERWCALRRENERLKAEVLRLREELNAMVTLYSDAHGVARETVSELMAECGLETGTSAFDYPGSAVVE